MAHLTQLHGSNFLRLKAVTVETNGKPAVIIGGRNEQGKSSVLAIAKCLLGGKREAPAIPLRRGAKKGAIHADLADVFDHGDLRVSRSVTQKGLGQLKITANDGGLLPSPQAIMDKLEIDQESAIRLKRAISLCEPINDTLRSAAYTAVRPVLNDMGTELLSCFRYFSSIFNREAVDRLTVAGLEVGDSSQLATR